MKNSLFLSRLLVLLFFSLFSGCSNSDTGSDKLLNDISNDLKQGLYVIVYQMTNKDKTSEQYADWSAYLNEFSSSKSDKYKIYEASSAFNKKLSSLDIPSNGDYTVFLKQDSKTYFYDGVIVEAMVYISVDNQFNNKEVSDMDRAFLPDAIDTTLK